MNLPKYNLSAGRNFRTFEFISEGPNGHILKLIRFTATQERNVVNLAFGDKDMVGDLDDIVVSNNDDRDKVLATIASAIYEFTDRFPHNSIYITGSTRARTRLYRMAISKYLDELRDVYIIYGELENNWEPFIKNMDYQGFLIKRKL